MGNPLCVLIIGDSQKEALALVRELKQGGFEPHHERVETAAAIRSALREKSWDIILSDGQIMGLNCLEALDLLKETRLDILFVIVSRTISEEMAFDAMKAGAKYCIKNRRERRQVEEELRRNRENAGRPADEMAVIAELGRVIGSTLNLIGGTYCNCYLYRPEADLLDRVANAGKEMFPHGDTTRHRGEGLVGHVWEQGVPLLVDDYHS